MLTETQQALFNKLATTQSSFSSLTEAEQAIVGATLRPSGGFTEEQRALLYPNWWLIVDDVDLLANDLPPGLGLAVIETLPITFSAELGWHDSGTSSNRRKQVLSASLLTDCRPGDTWGSIGSQLVELVIAKITPDLFPPPLEVP
jgi:hypothetical protein